MRSLIVRVAFQLSALAVAGNFALAAPAAAGDGIETAGDILTYALPLAAGTVALGKGDEDGILELGISYVGAVGTTLALKSVVREQRPDRSDHRSFPSGHATSAFAAAAFLDKRYGWHYGLPAYALATFVGYSRVEADKHHWGDVAAGAVIGWTFNQLVTTHFEGPLKVQPLVSTNLIGLNLELHW